MSMIGMLCDIGSDLYHRLGSRGSAIRRSFSASQDATQRPDPLEGTVEVPRAGSGPSLDGVLQGRSGPEEVDAQRVKSGIEASEVALEAIAGPTIETLHLSPSAREGLDRHAFKAGVSVDRLLTPPGGTESRRKSGLKPNRVQVFGDGQELLELEGENLQRPIEPRSPLHVPAARRQGRQNLGRETSLERVARAQRPKHPTPPPRTAQCHEQGIAERAGESVEGHHDEASKTAFEQEPKAVLGRRITVERGGTLIQPSENIITQA
jgi:hypothetical protein